MIKGDENSKVLRQSFYLALLAEAYGHADPPNQGIDATTEALALVSATGERRWEAMIHCVRGALFTRRSNIRPDAESCFSRALKIAGAQKARSFELQAALGLVQL